jgi:glutamate formiminotransferase
MKDKTNKDRQEQKDITEKQYENLKIKIKMQSY